jgi:hypothetical protein
VRAALDLLMFATHGERVKMLKSAARTIVAVAVLATAGIDHAARAQDVRVDVSLRSVVANGVPRVFRYGGNIWWIPPVFAAGVAEKILNMKPLGMTRVSLGDQVLQHATSLEDLRRRLERYPLNDFLRKYANEGGRVLFILDGVPRWVSANKATRQLKDPTQPIFRMSPPADFEEWSKVVEAIVRHFNGRLGLDAYYESWNEPNWYYLGTTDQYLKQYYHSVLGARRADPKALIGGPAISEFIGVTTRRLGSVTKAETLDAVKMQLQQNYLFKQFLDYAGRTPVPELGLKRLPVDFFSWHSFYMDPTSYYALVVPAIRDALASAGYPKNTPLINTEWNLAAVPPYPEGDLNASEVGAAYVGTSLLAMHASRVDDQIFQMYVDPGVEGYHGGTFTQSGIPRANFNVFRLFSRVKGKQLRAESTDPWVKSAAFSDGKRVYVLLTTFVPTAKMTADTERIRNALENAQFLSSLEEAGLASAMAQKRKLPDSFARKGSEIAERTRKRMQQITQKAAAWNDGVTLEIALSDASLRPRSVKRYLIDASHSNIHGDLKKAEERLHEQQRQERTTAIANVRGRLHDAGIDDASIARLQDEIRKKKPLEQALTAVPPAKRNAARRAIAGSVKDSLQRYKATLDEIDAWDSARLYADTLPWPPSGNLRIRTKPYSVQLLVFEQ